MDRRAVLLLLTGLSMAFAGCTWLEESTDTDLTNSTPDETEAPPSSPSPATPTSTSPTPVTTTPSSPSPTAPAPATVPVVVVPVVQPAPAPVQTTQPPPSGPQHESWPREGSYVEYHVEGWVTRGEVRDTLVWVNWTYSRGDWRAVCEGSETRQDDGETRSERIRETISIEDPPHWPILNTRSPPAAGQQMEVWYLSGCDITSEERTYGGIRDGVHYAEGTEPYDRYHTEWDPITGLVRGWDLHQTGGGSSGTLVRTDAPLSKPVGYVGLHG